jgi:hypothetical protein
MKKIFFILGGHAFGLLQPCQYSVNNHLLSPKPTAQFVRYAFLLVCLAMQIELQLTGNSRLPVVKSVPAPLCPPQTPTDYLGIERVP